MSSRAVNQTNAKFPCAIANVERVGFIGVIKGSVRVIMNFNKGLEIAVNYFFKPGPY